MTGIKVYNNGQWKELADKSAWGKISGTLADQTDLKGALDGKATTAALSAEETARSSADSNLQQQIDGITSRADVTDVVGTKAELLAYPHMSEIVVRDMIKVLADESRNSERTYYRWNGSVWEFVGTEGLTYTKGQTDDLLAGKQPLGEYATKTELTDGLAGKQASGDYALKSELPDISGKLDKSGGAMTGYLSDKNAGQVRNLKYSAVDPTPSDGVVGDIWVSPIPSGAADFATKEEVAAISPSATFSNTNNTLSITVNNKTTNVVLDIPPAVEVVDTWQ